MSQAALNALERDVEQARARFADDLARLRSPRLKDDLWAEARDTKDGIVADLKERAVGNPVALLAIGAGLAWRLYRHPPIASLLVGYGLVSLLRTSGSQRSTQAYMDLEDEDPPARRYREESIASRASELAGAAKQKVGEWGERASDTARETAQQVAEKTAAVADRASAAARDTVTQLKEKATVAADRTADATRETVSQIKQRASSAVDRASGALHDAIPDPETRDRLLFGAAALAVAAAVGIAYQRSQEEV